MSVVPLSPEVVKHHVRLHGCPNMVLVAMPCPCGQSHCLFCMDCDEPLLLAIKGDGCEHAKEVM